MFSDWFNHCSFFAGVTLVTMVTRGAFLASVMSVEPKDRSVRLAVDSVRANQTSTDLTAINAPPDITTSQSAHVRRVFLDAIL